MAAVFKLHFLNMPGHKKALPEQYEKCTKNKMKIYAKIHIEKTQITMIQ